MSLANARTLTAGTLDGGSLVVLAQTTDGFQSNSQVAPGGDWSGWSYFTNPGPSLTNIACAFLAGGGANMTVFANSADLGIQTSDEGLATWSAWNNTPTGYLLAAGAILGGQEALVGGNVIGAGPKFAAQLWAWNGETLSSMTTSPGGSWGPWSAFQSPQNMAGPPILRPLYGPNNEGMAKSALWSLQSVSASAPGGLPYLTLSWAQLPEYSYISDNRFTIKWGTWVEFNPPLPASSGGVASLAAGYLPNGAIQIFAVDVQGALWTIWQEVDSSGNYFWPGQWNLFKPPIPGERTCLALSLVDFGRTGHNFFEGAAGEGGILDQSGLQAYGWSWGRDSLALAQTAAGELQLFVIANDGTVWTTRKEGTHNGAFWSPWQQF
jgi:hypothetical protein